MPSLGAGMDAGTLLEWYVDPGSEVHRGDIVALVETDKAAIEVEVFQEGVVTDLVVPEGTKVPVGTVLAHLTAPDEDAGGEDGTHTATGDAESDQPDEPTETDAAVSPGGDEHPHHAVVQSPLVRRLAAQRGVDLDRIAGTGPHGSITRDDVAHAADDQSAAVAPSAGSAPTPVPTPAPTPAPLPTTTPPPGHRHRSSPYARRLAAETGVDLARLSGSGPGGAVVAHDIDKASGGEEEHGATRGRPGTAQPVTAAAPPASAAPRSSRAASGAGNEAMRRAIARSMAQSNREIPHYHLRHAVDMEATLQWLEARNADRPPAERVLPAVLVLKATALACRDHPDLNGFWVDDAFQPSDAVHVGVAISLRGGGLVAPAIQDTDHRSLDEVMAALVDLVKRARAGRLRGSELTDPTITVTNLGDRGVEVVHGLVHPPQVALVGAGRITPRPWAVDDMVGVRRVLDVSLAADHRASDGHLGGLFLASIARHLQEPEEL